MGRTDCLSRNLVMQFLSSLKQPRYVAVYAGGLNQENDLDRDSRRIAPYITRA